MCMYMVVCLPNPFYFYLQLLTMLHPSRIHLSIRSESCKIFVGGLSPEVTEHDFQEYFARFGDIKDAVVMVDRNTGKFITLPCTLHHSPRTIHYTPHITHHTPPKTPNTIHHTPYTVHCAP
ncbi:hypothetical protein EON63_22855 [archaeon]|nr:MAG: hypothetical protein EON63_22855 [archaeon]